MQASIKVIDTIPALRLYRPTESRNKELWSQAIFGPGSLEPEFYLGHVGRCSYSTFGLFGPGLRFGGQLDSIDDCGG